MTKQTTIAIMTQNGQTLKIEGQGYSNIATAKKYIQYFKAQDNAKNVTYAKYFTRSKYKPVPDKKYFVMTLDLR